MDVDREHLQKLREQIGRKAHLTSMLDNLADRSGSGQVRSAKTKEERG